jgi:hypothetical protein
VYPAALCTFLLASLNSFVVARSSAVTLIVVRRSAFAPPITRLVQRHGSITTAADFIAHTPGLEMLAAAVARGPPRDKNGRKAEVQSKTLRPENLTQH